MVLKIHERVHCTGMSRSKKPRVSLFSRKEIQQSAITIPVTRTIGGVQLVSLGLSPTLSPSLFICKSEVDKCTMHIE